MSLRLRPALSVLCFVLAGWAPATLLSQPVEVDFVDGHLTVRCNNAGLEQVFQEIETKAGVELILEDEVKSKRLTAELVHEPLQIAIQRLLDGVGVNYAVLMDPTDWGRVNKVFVGAGGGGNGRPLPPRAPAPAPVDDFGDEGSDGFDEMDNFGEDEFGADEFGEDAFGEDEMNMDPGMGPDTLPPGVDPNAAAQGGFNYFGQNNFTRSNVTPGLPSAPPFAAPTTPTNPAAPPQGQNPGALPPGYPYTDQFGQPIPVPPARVRQPPQQNNNGNPPNR